LQHPPDAAHAPDHAAATAATAKNIDGVDLDFSPASLGAVDAILDRFHSDRVGSDAIAETLWAFGCYVGEVFVRHAGAKWASTPPEHRATVGFPIVVGYGGHLVNPIGKVFKRVDEGSEHNLPYFFQVMTIGAST
jgi:hypothetical protein